MKKRIPLNEIRYEWTYVDLLKANAMIDFEEMYEMAQSQIIEDERPKIKPSKK